MPVCFTITEQSPGHRRGTVTPWLVAALMVIFWVFAWAFDVAFLRERQQELRTSLDATALAAAGAAVDERQLTSTPSQDDIIASIRQVAQQVAGANRVNSLPLTFDLNLNNFVDGDLVIGKLDNYKSHAFDTDLTLPPDLYHPQLNAVRMTIRTRGVAATATAFVDRDLIGFKPAGSLTVPLERDVLSCGISRNDPVIPAIPVVPLAVLTDPCNPVADDNSVNQACWEARNPNSWEYRIMARRGLNGDGSDEWLFDVGSCGPQTGSDDIPEMLVTVSATGHQQGDNGQVLGIGVSAAADAIGQVQTGITYQHLLQPRHNPGLPPFNGQLVLNDGLNQNNPQNQLILPQLALSGSDIDALAANLNAIRGQRRAWMLYSQVQPDNTAVVAGFVVARVMDTGVADVDDGNNQSHRQLSIVIQPSMLITATAVTDYTRRNLGPRSLFNPYACKVRLVD